MVCGSQKKTALERKGLVGLSRHMALAQNGKDHLWKCVEVKKTHLDAEGWKSF